MSKNNQMYQHPHLAWHETMELHELTAFQTNQLENFKMVVNDVSNPQLRALYLEAIKSLEHNLKELLQFYPKAPQWPQGTRQSKNPGMDLTPFYAGQLLGFAKTAVRTYAAAITETATPQLRETFTKQLNAAIQLHAKTFNFMYEKGYYPAYDLPKLLANDVANANRVLAL